MQPHSLRYSHKLRKRITLQHGPTLSKHIHQKRTFTFDTKSLSKRQPSKEYFDWIAEQLHIVTSEDWANPRPSSLHIQNLHSVVQQHFGGSLCTALKWAYPQFEWKSWKLSETNEAFWKEQKNCKEFCDWLSSELGIHTQKEWTQLSLSNLNLRHYQGSLYDLLSTTYPQYEWKASSFVDNRELVINDPIMKREAVESIGELLGITELHQWQRVDPVEFVQCGGGDILESYNNSLYAMLCSVYSDYPWKLWQFKDQKLPYYYWTKHQHKRRYLDSVADDYSIETSDDWYKLKSEDVNKKGYLVFELYGGSLSKALLDVYPEFTWHMWKFENVPLGWWTEATNRRAYIDWLSEELGLESMDDWYTVRMSHIKTVGYTKLLDNYYHGSLSKALIDIFPQHDWKPWKFEYTPLKIYWEHRKSRREYLDWLLNKLKVKTYDEIYSVDWKNVSLDRTFSGLYDGCIIKALTENYPEFIWFDWIVKGTSLPPDFFADPTNQRRYFDWLSDKLEITHFEQWYNIQAKSLRSYGIGRVLEYHGWSLPYALCSVYPEHPFRVWKFSIVPKRFWASLSNQRQFLDWAGEQLGLKELDDWYNVTAVEFMKVPTAAKLLEYYNSSLAKALMKVYPDHPWKVWLFRGLKISTIAEDFNVDEYRDWLKEKLHINDVEDLRGISWKQFKSVQRETFVRNLGGMESVLKKVFSEDAVKYLTHNTTKSQHSVYRILKKTFPDHEIKMEHVSSFYSGSHSPMTLDIYIPSLSLAFEFQGFQHYQSSILRPNADQQTRDMEKRMYCKREGITLIEVPFWWDYKDSSLLASIHAQRPELNVGGKGEPIPLFPDNLEHGQKANVCDFISVGVAKWE